MHFLTILLNITFMNTISDLKKSFDTEFCYPIIQLLLSHCLIKVSSCAGTVM